MIGVDKELIMDSLNYIDEHFHLISYNLAIKSGILTLLLLLLSNYSKESAIYNQGWKKSAYCVHCTEPRLAEKSLGDTFEAPSYF